MPGTVIPSCSSRTRLPSPSPPVLSRWERELEASGHTDWHAPWSVSYACAWRTPCSQEDLPLLYPMRGNILLVGVRFGALSASMHSPLRGTKSWQLWSQTDFNVPSPAGRGFYHRLRASEGCTRLPSPSPPVLSRWERELEASGRFEFGVAISRPVVHNASFAIT